MKILAINGSARKLSNTGDMIDWLLNKLKKQIAVAYAVNKGTYPIIGVTKSYQVEEAALADRIKLSPKEVSVLEGLAEAAGVETKGAGENHMV